MDALESVVGRGRKKRVGKNSFVGHIKGLMIKSLSGVTGEKRERKCIVKEAEVIKRG